MKTSPFASLPHRLAAFTRNDFVAMVAAGGLLGCVFLGALGRANSNESHPLCLQRLNLLARAMIMFAVDNRDALPPNPDDGNTTPGRNWCPGQAGIGGQYEFNADILRDPSRALFHPYLNGEVWVYRCPEDPRLGRYTGTNLTLRGKLVPSTRTLSMNNAVGTDPSRGGLSVHGPWLDGDHNHTANKTWYCYGKLTDFIRPGPANTFTFIEEDHRSLNDGTLAVVGPSPNQRFKMIDWPATYHDNGCAVAFADGHVVMHRWVDARTTITGSSFVQVQDQPNSPDILWLAQRASALIRE